MAAQGACGHQDTMQPSLRCVPISDSKYPKLLDVSENKGINGQNLVRLGSWKCNCDRGREIG